MSSRKTDVADVEMEKRERKDEKRKVEPIAAPVTEFDLTMGKIVEDWGLNSKVHGASNIFRNPSKILKIFWIICLFASLGYCETFRAFNSIFFAKSYQVLCTFLKLKVYIKSSWHFSPTSRYSTPLLKWFNNDFWSKPLLESFIFP